MTSISMSSIPAGPGLGLTLGRALPIVCRSMRCAPRLLLASLLPLVLAGPLPAQRGAEDPYRDFRAELILAIEERDLGRARQVIAEGADEEINRGDPSPLGEAIRLDNLNMVALLLRSGGDPNAVADRPFKDAFRNDSLDMVRLLYQVGARLTESELPEVLKVTLRGENAIPLYRELLNRGTDVDLALRVAVENRKLEATQLCLERGADVSTLGELDVFDLNGLEPEMYDDLFSKAVREENRAEALSYFLGLAAARGNRELLDQALKEGAQVSIEHLARAESQGNYEIARFLLDKLREDLSSLIERAEAENHPALAAYLKGLRSQRIARVVGPVVAVVASLFVLVVLAFFLRKHILHSPKRLFEAITSGRTDVLEKLLGEGAEANALHRGGPLLHAAAARGDLKSARLLLRNQADVNRPAEEPSREAGMAPLHVAVRGGNVALATLLLRSGAKVDARTPEGLTPLYFAAAAGNSEMVQLLVGRGADLNALVHEHTILHQAVGRRDHRAVATLLEAGADPNADRGKTALHTAATLGDTELVRILLEYGADPYAVDIDGRTAIDLASFHRQGDAFALLQGGVPRRPAPIRQPARTAAAAPAEQPGFSIPPPPAPPAPAPGSYVPASPPPPPSPVFETMVIPPPEPPEVVSPAAAAYRDMGYGDVATPIPSPEEPRIPPPSFPMAPSVDSFTIPLPDHGKKDD